MTTLIDYPNPELLGQHKRFGAYGPIYQILHIVRTLPDGDWLLRIRVLKTGEETDYRHSQLIEDPVAFTRPKSG